ncbi:MAG: M56 family metallopeptidase, partial [Bryobacteraceae bacterium]
MTVFFLAATIKATIILLCALALNFALRKRASAALRHVVWLAALLCVVLLPAVSLIVPAKPAQSLTISTALLPAASGLAVITGTSGHTPANLAPFGYLLVVLWVFGALVASARIAIGLIRIALITRRAAPGGSADTAHLKWSSEIPAPLTWGILRPVVLLPTASANWQADWLRFVKNHELAHVARKDWLSQMLAQGACALYWFHPLAWLAVARMRREAERACDDLVLTAGTDAIQYASCLLDVARAWSLDATLETGTLAMACPSGIEVRVRSILDISANRRPVKRASLIAAGLAALVLLLVLGPTRSVAQESTTGLSGSIYDPSGAAVPHALVAAKSTSSDREEITNSDGAGAYSFPGLASG